jgi:hypothetical protein
VKEEIMIRQLVWLFALVIVVAPCRGDSDPKDYVADGKLKEPLEIRDVKGGAGGFERSWKIAADGGWSADYMSKNMGGGGKGTLSAENLNALSKQLAAFDLMGLKSQGKAKDKESGRVITIKWGQREASLTVESGGKLPKADPKTPEGRFGGIVDAVQRLIPIGNEKD